MLVFFLHDFCTTVEIKTTQNENKQAINSKLGGNKKITTITCIWQIHMGVGKFYGEKEKIR